MAASINGRCIRELVGSVYFPPVFVKKTATDLFKAFYFDCNGNWNVFLCHWVYTFTGPKSVSTYALSNLSIGNPSLYAVFPCRNINKDVKLFDVVCIPV